MNKSAQVAIDYQISLIYTFSISKFNCELATATKKTLYKEEFYEQDGQKIRGVIYTLENWQR